MVPELNQSVEDASRVSVWKALGVFSLQNLGMQIFFTPVQIFFDNEINIFAGILVGIGCLYTLARFQDDIAISL